MTTPIPPAPSPGAGSAGPRSTDPRAAGPRSTQTGAADSRSTESGGVDSRSTESGAADSRSTESGAAVFRSTESGAADSRVTETGTEAPSSASATAPAVELRGVTRRFGAQTAVDDLTLTIPHGQVLALLGPNGAGKSTTTEMILGLQEPDAGTVRVCGMAPHRAAHQGLVGAMLQSGALLDEVTVATMLHLVAGVCAHPRPVAEVVEEADIATLLRKGTSKLSGGEAQRVRLALALLPDPEVILLDEPTVAMDVETRRRFWQRMRHVAAEGRTIVFATHYLEEADEHADRVVVLDAGRIVADGTGAEISASLGGRHITAQLADPQDAALIDQLRGLPEVSDVQRGEESTVRIACADSDAVLAALFAPGGPVAEGRLGDIGVTRPSLEEAFVQLTRH